MDMVHWSRVAILFLVLIEAGWMAFDGIRALIVGDFITPKTGSSAGQLGPWRHLVQRVGLNPRGTPMKLVFAVYGLTWLTLGIGFLRGASWGWSAMLFAAIGALWFLPIGTLFSLIQITLLLAFRTHLR
jgi:hypothetical protein